MLSCCIIKKDIVKKNSIIIDVVINYKNWKIIGNVDFDNIFKKVKYITTVSNGVESMTIAILSKNVLKVIKNNKKCLNKCHICVIMIIGIGVLVYLYFYYMNLEEAKKCKYDN